MLIGVTAIQRNDWITDKFTEGVSCKKEVINYILSACSFNCLPVNYIQVVEEKENKNNVRIIQKCYIKVGETNFSRSSTPFSTIPRDIDIQEARLIYTDNLIPCFLRKRPNKTKRSNGGMMPTDSKD